MRKRESERRTNEAERHSDRQAERETDRDVQIKVVLTDD